jgi:uncharacterized protein
MLKDQPESAITEQPIFQPLDPRVMNLWRLTDGLALAVLLLLLLAGVGIGWWFLPELGLWLVAAWGLLAVGSVVLVLWYPLRAYRAWGFRVTERVLETRSGVWFQRTQLLPLTRLQHVDLERGPLERMFGLASLVLHTAGTHAASLTIPGLEAEYAVRLRDWLVQIGGDDAV